MGNDRGKRGLDADCCSAGIGISALSVRRSFEYRDVVSFGLYSERCSVINVFYNLAPQLLLAKMLDFASVGLYSRAVNITQVFDQLVMQVLSPVIMPAIFARNKAGADLSAIYLDAIAAAFGGAMAFPDLHGDHGAADHTDLARPEPGWRSFRWSACYASLNMALFAACLTYPVLVAVGSVRDALVSSLISLPPSLPVVLCASFLGVPGRCSIRTADVTVPGRSGDLFHRTASWPCGSKDVANALFKSSMSRA